ncbi:MAG: delta-60 repeat domain-containing protein, partial [Deltaproteobacteria bacterium]|nr:delta-60 repeat domain-containing protein [Deltaproteobacteria bacterium]
IIVATEDIFFLITTTGSANIYEDEACETINPNKVLLKDEQSTPFYIKGPNVEEVMIEYNDAEVGSIAITTLSDHIATAINGPVYAIEPIASNVSDFYIGGGFTTIAGAIQNRITRLKANGALDDDFNIVGSGLSGLVRAIFRIDENADDIVLAGDWTQINGLNSRNLASFNGLGVVDTTYNPDGGFNASAYALAMDSTGKLYVGGAMSTWFPPSVLTPGLTRFTAPGVVETFLQGSGFSGGTVQALLIDDDDDIYVGGAFNAYNGNAHANIVRLNNNGSVDNAFNKGSGLNGDVKALAWSVDGQIYIGGGFTTYKGSSQNRLVRVSSTGSKDNAFDIGSGFNGEVYSINVQADGSLYVGGAFTTYNGTTVNRIVKLNADGAIDTSFESGLGFNSSVYTITMPNDYSGDLWVGGAFTAYQGQTQNYLVRLDAQGNLD